MKKQTVIKAAQFALDCAHEYKGKLSEMILDALFYSHVKMRNPNFHRQYKIQKKKNSPRIDFRNSTTNPCVIELAHRKRGSNQGFSPRANKSELRKLTYQTNKRWRYLIIIDANKKALDTAALEAKYKAFLLPRRRGQRKPITVIYVHRSGPHSFTWP